MNENKQIENDIITFARELATKTLPEHIKCSKQPNSYEIQNIVFQSNINDIDYQSKATYEVVIDNMSIYIPKDIFDIIENKYRELERKKSLLQRLDVVKNAVENIKYRK